MIDVKEYNTNGFVDNLYTYMLSFFILSACLKVAELILQLSPLNYKDRSKNVLGSRRSHTLSFIVYIC